MLISQNLKKLLTICIESVTSYQYCFPALISAALSPHHRCEEVHIGCRLCWLSLNRKTPDPNKTDSINCIKKGDILCPACPTSVAEGKHISVRLKPLLPTQCGPTFFFSLFAETCSRFSSAVSSTIPKVYVKINNCDYNSTTCTTDNHTVASWFWSSTFSVCIC